MTARNLCTVNTELLRTILLNYLQEESYTVEYNGHEDTGFALMFSETPLMVSEISLKPRTFENVSVEALRTAAQSSSDTLTVTDDNGILVVNGVKCIQTESPNHLESPDLRQPSHRAQTVTLPQTRDLTDSTIVEKSTNGVKSLSAAALAPYIRAYAIVEAAALLSCAHFGFVKTHTGRRGWHIDAGSVIYSLDLSDPCETRIIVRARVRNRWRTVEIIRAPKLPSSILYGILKGIE